MTLQQFIQKYDGVPNVGNTDGNRGECVGLVMVYIAEVLELSHIWGHAKNIFNNAPDSEWIKIENSPDIYPQAGDIMCWDGTMGFGYGHIGIVESSSPATDSFVCFEQNYPTGSPPHLVNRSSWRGIIGWLRPKGDSCEKQLAELSAKYDSLKVKLDVERSEHADEVASLNQTLEETEKLRSEAVAEKVLAQDALKDTKTRLEGLETQHRALQDKFTDYKTKCILDTNDLKAKLADSEIKRKQAEKKFEDLTIWEFILIKLRG